MSTGRLRCLTATSTAGSATRSFRSRCPTAGTGSSSSAHGDSRATRTVGGCVQDRRASEGVRIRPQRPRLVPLHIIDETEDKYFESRRRILQLTNYTKATLSRHYGARPLRTYMVGGSNGGHNTKMMVEDYPSEYDGGIAGYGITSHLEWMGSNTRFVRNFDVFASRIDDIIAARTADPNWNPVYDPAQPAAHCGSDPGVAQRVQHAGAGAADWPSTSGVRRAPSTDGRRPARPGRSANTTRSSATRRRRSRSSIGSTTRTATASSRSRRSRRGIPNLSPPPVANDLRRFDNTGNSRRPIIIGHGSHDPIVSPGETAVYKRLVEKRFGIAGARDLLAVYYIPGMGHGGAEYDAMIGPALDALEAWVD